MLFLTVHKRPRCPARMIVLLVRHSILRCPLYQNGGFTQGQLRSPPFDTNNQHSFSTDIVKQKHRYFRSRVMPVVTPFRVNDVMFIMASLPRGSHSNCSVTHQHHHLVMTAETMTVLHNFMECAFQRRDTHAFESSSWQLCSDLLLPPGRRGHRALLLVALRPAAVCNHWSKYSGNCNYPACQRPIPPHPGQSPWFRNNGNGNGQGGEGFSGTLTSVALATSGCSPSPSRMLSSVQVMLCIACLRLRMM